MILKCHLKRWSESKVSSGKRQYDRLLRIAIAYFFGVLKND